MEYKPVIETDLARIKHFASVREKENERFRRFLKGTEGTKTDAIVYNLNEEIVRQIDCTLCGNCCSSLNTGINGNEIERLAALENISPEEYISDYCDNDDGGMSLKCLPCRYLNDKKCTVYENRPEECRRFPYTGEKGFIFRLWAMNGFYGICPIVFNVMERLKDMLRFYR